MFIFVLVSHSQAMIRWERGASDCALDCSILNLKWKPRAVEERGQRGQRSRRLGAALH